MSSSRGEGRRSHRSNRDRGTTGSSTSTGSGSRRSKTSVKFDRLGEDEEDSLYSGIGLTSVDILGTTESLGKGGGGGYRSSGRGVSTFEATGGVVINPRDDPLLNQPHKTPSPNDDNFALLGDGTLENVESAKVERKRRQYEQMKRRWIVTTAVVVVGAFVCVIGYFSITAIVDKQRQNRSAGGGTSSTGGVTTSSTGGGTGGGGTNILNQTPTTPNGNIVYPDRTPTSTFDPVVFGTDTGTYETTSNMMNMKQAILESGLSTSAQLQVGANTSQRRALRWLIEYDPSKPQSPLPTVGQGVLDPKTYNPTMPSVLDRYALSVFFFATNGPEWTTNRNWLLHNNICNWQGIYCQQMLDENSITRTGISSINLPLNDLKSNQLPKELFHSNIMKHLNLLNLHTNDIGGTIPTDIGNLRQLETLALYNNTLSGSLPNTIGDMSSLTNLLLSGNNLIGSLPNHMGSLSRLEQLQLYDNQFFGIIPATFQRLVRLKRLWLSKNRFSGRIPNAIFAEMKSLQALYLDENFLSGPLGGNTGLGQATSLKDIRVYKNVLTGQIPSQDLAKLTKLELLYLDQNQFRGTLSNDMFYSMTNLRELSLFKNQLQGTLPDSIGSLVSLEVLDVGENQLSGNLPFSIGNLRKLCKLRLYKNKFIGEIPNLENLQDLDDIEVQHNMLSGRISASIGMTNPKLRYLILSDNKFVGYLPDTLGRLTMLKNFRVDRNDLLGSVPQSICARSSQYDEIVTDCDMECTCCTSCVASNSNEEVTVQGKNWNL